jgi:molybdopterin molybdotransferase
MSTAESAPPPSVDAPVDTTQRDAAAGARLADDCFRPGAPLMRHGEAVAILRARLTTLADTETVPLAAAGGRTLAAAVVAPAPVPAHTNAAVDGYAFAASAETRATGATLTVTGRAAAGHPSATLCAPGAAVRIFTGAVMPAGTDTVVMQEDVRVADGAVAVPAGLKPGANVRRAGEDVAAGATLLARGHRMRPQDLAALASVGCDRVAVYRPIRVGVVSTGDEVIAAGTAPLAPGQVYDANAPMLAALAALAGAEVVPLGIWPDRRDVVTARLAAAARDLDVVITTGGASTGEEDHMAAAIAALGRRHLWQLAIKPGRPMMLGHVQGAAHDTIVLGLPGNPVAVFVCFLLYVYPMLRVLGGGPWPEPERLMLPAAFTFSGRKRGRREYWRASLVAREGRLHVEKFARDGSGLISGLRAATGLIEIAEEHGDVAEGDLVPFVPLSAYGIV